MRIAVTLFTPFLLALAPDMRAQGATHPAATLGLGEHIDWIDDGAIFLDSQRAKRSLLKEEMIDRQALLDEAIGRAAAEDKLVMWYVYRIIENKLRGRQMYRSPVLDVYMQQVVFADADVASVIKGRFVPVRMVCDEALSERYGLRPLEFVEPAVVFLDGEGKVVHFVERIRTFHAQWFVGLLLRVLDHSGVGVKPAADAGADQLIAQGRFRRALTVLSADPEKTSASYLAMARVQRLLRLPEQALDSLTKAETRLDPKDRPLSGDIAAERGLVLTAMGRPQDALPHLERAFGIGASRAAEAGYLHALNTLRMGDESGAMQRFQQVATRYPDTPAGRKARANTLLGPDDRPIGAAFSGYESVRYLPEAAYQGLPRDTTWAGEPLAPLDMAVRAIEFLLAQQRDDGGFTDARYAYWPSSEITPNVWVAITALCCTALLENRALAPDVIAPATIDKALQRGEAFMFDPEQLRRGKNEDVYSDTYRLMYLAKRHQLADPTLRARVVDQMNDLVQAAQQRQKEDGFWAHEYRNAFCSGAMMWGLLIARSAGATVPDEMVDKGTAALLSARYDNGAYSYGGAASSGGTGSLKDASARMPLCEAVLLAQGRSDQERLGFALENFWKHMDRIETVRRNDFHSDGELAGFFFFHSIFHVAEICKLLPDSERAAHYERFLALLQKIPEMDGSFLDSHELGRSYGTAMALLTLRNVAEF